MRARSLEYKIDLVKGFKNEFWNDFGTGAIHPVIDSVIDWTMVSEAHRYMEANKNTGKIVLRIK